MSPLSIPFSTWILAALDPALIAVALYLGYKADQAGKIVIAAIAALGASLLFDYLLTSIGIPLPAPVSRTGPMLLPVRSLAALLWSAVGFAVGRFSARLRAKTVRPDR